MQTLFRYKGIFSWYYKASKYPTNHASTIIILLIFNNFENRLAKFDKNSTFSVPPSFFFYLKQLYSSWEVAVAGYTYQKSL